MGEPVDTSAEAVERLASEFESLADNEYKMHWCHYYDAATLLRSVQSALNEARLDAKFNKDGWDGAFRQAMENGAAANELRDQLTAAQQRIADLEAQCANDATLSTALDAVIAERDAAFNQVDALRVNARRYEWLRDSCPPVSAYHHLQHSPSECDARIDAAMAAKVEG